MANVYCRLGLRPFEQSATNRLEGPDAVHVMGRDGYGRDVFARVLSAGRVSLAVGVGSVAIGGAYGLPHGALNAICLPPALRFNADFVPSALLEGRAAERAEQLSHLSGFTTLGALGVPKADLPRLADAIAQRPGAKANPREATPTEAEALLCSVF